MLLLASQNIERSNFVVLKIKEEIPYIPPKFRPHFEDGPVKEAPKNALEKTILIHSLSQLDQEKIIIGNFMLNYQILVLNLESKIYSLTYSINLCIGRI